jgi:hypothetical protein
MPRWIQLLGFAIWIVAVVNVWSRFGVIPGIVTALIAPPLILLVLGLVGRGIMTVTIPGWNSFVDAWEDVIGSRERRAEDITEAELAIMKTAFDVFRRDGVRTGEPALHWIHRNALVLRTACRWATAGRVVATGRLLQLLPSGGPLAVGEVVGTFGPPGPEFDGVAIGTVAGVELIGRSLRPGDAHPAGRPASPDSWSWEAVDWGVPWEAVTTVVPTKSGFEISFAASSVFVSVDPASGADRWRSLFSARGFTFPATPSQ